MVRVLLYDIRVTSNWSTVMAKDSATTGANTQAKIKNTQAEIANDAAKTRLGRVTSLLTKKYGKGTDATKKDTAASIKNMVIKRLMYKATHTAGLNIGMLSIRIHEGLVPVLAIMASAMLPVITGLLAIASAAIAAGLGVAGLVGIGLYKWSKDFKNSTSNMGYAGGRQPYTSSGKEPQFITEVMSGIVDVLGSKDIEFQMRNAMKWTKAFFHDMLPNALKIFIQSVDMFVMKDIFDMLGKWLPEAAEGLAKWGSELFKVIGKGSLKRMNNFFKWMAGGLINIGKWLNKSGFEQIDAFTDSLSQFISQLMELGKAALPVLITAMDAIYPTPFKPIINGLIALFKSINGSKIGTDTINTITRLVIAIMALGALEAVLAPLWGVIHVIGIIISTFTIFTVGFSSFLVALILLGAGLLLWIATWDNDFGRAVKKVLVGFGSLIINAIIFMWNRIAHVLNGIFDVAGWLTGNKSLGEKDFTLDYRGYGLRDDESFGANNQFLQTVKVIIESNDEKLIAYVDDGLEEEVSKNTAGAYAGMKNYAGTN